MELNLCKFEIHICYFHFYFFLISLIFSRHNIQRDNFFMMNSCNSRIKYECLDWHITKVFNKHVSFQFSLVFISDNDLFSIIVWYDEILLECWVIFRSISVFQLLIKKVSTWMIYCTDFLKKTTIHIIIEVF